MKKRKKVKIELDKLVKGTKIESYGFYSNLTFVEASNGHVTMSDKFGNEHIVFDALFVKNAVILESA